MAGQDGTSNGTHGFAGIVGKVPLMDGGKVEETVKSLAIDEIVRRNRGVVDLGDVDVIPNLCLLVSFFTLLGAVWVSEGETQKMAGVHTSVAVLEVGSILVISGVDNWQNALVQVQGLIIRLLVVSGGEVGVGALDAIVTAAGTLEPTLVFSLVCRSSIADGVDRNILVSAKRTLNLGSVSEGLALTSRGVQSLEERQGRVVQNGILGCNNGELRQDGVVAADTGNADRGVGLDVALAIEGSGRVNLFGPESSQVHRSPSLGGAVTMAVKDVDAQNTLLGSRDQRGGGGGRQGNKELGLHCLLGGGLDVL